MNATPILESWRQFDAVAHDYLTPITSEDQNERALELLEYLWKEVPDGETTHPLFPLLDLLTARISAFEAVAYPIPASTPERILAYLMDQKGWTQTQTAQATGIYQSNLSKILRGERSLTLEQVRTLAKVFKISAAVFL